MSDRIVFRRDNPVLRNHRAYGRELMPGLTYIDIVLQHFRDMGVDPRTLSLRNLALYRALTVPVSGTLEARILATRTDFGWRTEIVDADDQRFIAVDVVVGEPVQFEDRIDPAALRAPGRQQIPLESIYANCRAADMVHEGFMKASGTLFPREDALVAEIQIPECARESAAHFLFHPTLLDAGSLATGMAFADQVGAEEPLFLPLTCGAFKWSETLRDACYARVRRSSVRRQGVLLIRDLEFFNSAGQKVAEIGNFVCTLVRDPAHLGPRPVDTEAADGSADQIIGELRRLLAEHLRIPAGEISEEAGFYEIGLDSAMLLAVAEALGKRLGRSLPPTLLFEFTNLRALADHLRPSWSGHRKTTSPTTDKSATESPAAPGAAEPIAIIGLAGRYPGAANLSEFWDNLCQGRDSVVEIPASRWDFQDYAHLRSRTGRPISRWGGFIDAPDAFDARFFRISPREAEMMDPQERQFMQVCWEALEDAGYTPETISTEHGPQKRRSVGVFAGVMHKDYALVVAEAQNTAEPLPLSLNYAQIANRVSFFCGFHGPSLTVDTVCSSSLVAVHLAVESLRRRETDVCLAGGVNLSLHPAKYITYGQGNLFSTDGRCRAFGEGGDGYVPAEGVGAVVLKPLSRAIADRDPIYAVIRGSAVNHVGHVSGVTVPSPTAQADLVLQALHQAGVDARSIDMIEAHGTGTALGDPIEIEGLTQAFRTQTEDRQFCAIGSVKSNIGHAESAAGISGLTKLALQLHHRSFVPSLHAERTNSKIDFAASPFFVQCELAPWPEPAGGQPRRGGVSSFGATGTNAHLILEGFSDVSAATPVDRENGCVLPLSAQTEAQLRRQAGRVLEFLKANADASLADLAYTMQVGRKAFEQRIAFAVTDRAALIAELDIFAREGIRPEVSAATPALIQASAWLGGQAGDWEVLYRGRQAPRRLHAPTYAFAEDRYWAPIARPADDALLLAEPSWAFVPEGPIGAAADRIVVPILGQMSAPSWRAAPEAARIQWLDVAGTTFEDVAAALLGLIKQHARSTAGPQRWQIVVDESAVEGFADALSGLSRTVEQEIPTLALQLIVVETSAFVTSAQLMKAIGAASSRPDCSALRYKDAKLSARIWNESSPARSAVPWKDRGVYLISGGAGGLGLLFAREIAEKVEAPCLVLVGRSVLDEGRRASLNALEAAGARVSYECVDITDEDEVVRLVAHIRDTHGRIDGVIHSAGLLADALVRNKTEAVFRSVLAPKIAGTRALDAATAHLDLDFFVLFSSGAGVFGNAGQVDYATANAWQGSFAQQRHKFALAGKRRGRTLAIHWPLWAEGGMRPNTGTEQRWKEQTGLRPLSTQAGFAAFYRAMGADSPELLVLAGKGESLKRHFGIGQGIAAAPAPALTRAPAESIPMALPELPQRPAAEVVAAVLTRLKQILGDIIKLPSASIRSDDRLEDFGLDSVTVVEFSQRLANLSAGIPATLLYEFGDLRGVAQHLVDRYADDCVRWCGIAPVEQPAPTIPSAPTPAKATQPSSFTDSDQRIAIIGLAGRYPKSPDLDVFWTNLLAGRDCIGEVPSDRWDLSEFYEADRQAAVETGKSYSKWGGFLEGFADFDPLFFQISPMEAAAIDPQERLFIETAWQVFENAGYSRAEIQRRHQGRVGVFAGVTRTGFNLYALERWKAGDKMLPGTSFSSVSNRVSYLMNLCGPSMPVDTMCSSSLTAIHEACAHLLRGECDMALAGGVNLYLHPLNYVSSSAQQMLSPDGRCKTFGAGANGFVPGEGVGAVLLKRLSDAERDGDHISAVIRATAVNHNGRTNGYTVPNPGAQRDLVEMALAKASIDPQTITLVEAHGTGTELGDPIEIQGLQDALQAREAGRAVCAVGSVKSNVGHLEAAAGIAGLTKAVLQLRYRKIVPSLHSSEPNPKIDFASSALFVPQSATDWLAVERDGRPVPRRAGVSSFGAGGANAHVVLEEYLPADTPAPASGGPALIVLSARTLPALEAQASALLEHLTVQSLDLDAVAFTLQVGREAFAERLAIVASSTAELKEALRAFIGGRQVESIAHRGNLHDAPAAFEALRDDPDMDTLVAAWARNGRLHKIAAFWGQGFPIDWRQLYPGRTPKRVGLPTAHFDRQRFWIEHADPSVALQSRTVARDLDDAMFKPVWQRTIDLKRIDPAAHRSTVILHARSSEALATALAKAFPNSCCLVLADTDDPAEKILAIEPGVGCLVLVAAAPDVMETQPAESAALALLQRLKSSGLDLRQLELRLVTQNATDRAPSHGAGLHGLGMAWAQSGTPVAVCDIDAADLRDEERLAGIVDAVSRLAPDPRGDIVRFRHGADFSRQLVPISVSRETLEPPIRRGARYVIIGGAGLVGQIISRYLIDEYSAEIVWVGRSDPTSPDLRVKLDTFAASGAIPLYLQADTTDLRWMRAAAAQLTDVAGVFFAAMDFAFGDPFTVTQLEFERSLVTKETGAKNCFEAFKDRKLDFLCYFSSTQAYGFSDAQNSTAYAAGISAGDAAARQVAVKASFPVGIIHWGFWKAAVAGTILERNSGALDAPEALRCLERSLSLLRRGLLDDVVCMHLPSGATRSYVPLAPATLRQVASITPLTASAAAEPKPFPAARADDAGQERFDDLAKQVLLATLDQMGCFTSAGSQVGAASIATMMRRAGIAERYRGWLEEVVGVLRASGLFEAERRDIAAALAAWGDFENDANHDPAMRPMVALVGRCMVRLPEILRGEVPATEVIFPKGDIAGLGQVYEGNSWSDFFNSHVADAVADTVGQLLQANPEKVVRIVEIGAGTGGTARTVLARLGAYADRIQYLYTDVSPAFLQHGRDAFSAGASFVTFKRWNIDNPPEVHQIEEASCDIAIATNVLHATSDIRRTLRNVKASLRSHGLLVLNETVYKTLYGTLTFGLLDGWWAFSDGALRIPGAPLLSPSQWLSVLEEEGFETPRFLTEPSPASAQLVIVSRSDGWIRQAVEAVAIPVVRPSPTISSDTNSIQALAGNDPGAIRDVVMESLSEALRITSDRIDPKAPFSDYGVDSIVGTQVVTLIGKRLGVQLNAAVLYEHTSVERLASHLARTLPPVRVPIAPPEVPMLDIVQPALVKKEPLVVAEPAVDLIAVIGMAGQVPGAHDVDGFWRLLMGETAVPADRKLGEDTAFDPLFFRISPREAEGMSRHQRLVLMESWKALEDAAIAPSTLAGTRTSLYVGAEPTGEGSTSFTGSSDAIIASRLAYFLDLRGAALTVNTGCSSSATALHLACEALRHRETDLALAGGVFANLKPEIVAELTRIGMVSPTGRCMTFDADADGTVLCEGAGMVALKRLDDAIKAGDPIRGVIVASGTNQDGASNGITAPNGSAQEDLIASVYRHGNVSPETVSYIEAHGTGTALGDPVEANALIRAFGHATGRRSFCQIGSAKSVIGHASAAAGVIGLIKLLLCLEKRILPGLPNFARLNPLIDLAQSPFTIETEARAWEDRAEQGLTAGLSSFGHSGTNVHLVVRSFDTQTTNTPSAFTEMHAVPVSARTPAQLRASIAKLSEFLRATSIPEGPDRSEPIREVLGRLLGVDEQTIELDDSLDDLGVGPELRVRLQQELRDRTGMDLSLLACRTLRDVAMQMRRTSSASHELADVAFTLQHGRDHRETRAVFFAREIDDLLGQLDTYPSREGIDPVIPTGVPEALAGIAQRWLKGDDTAWLRSVHDWPARRLHLPSSAFPGSKEKRPAVESHDRVPVIEAASPSMPPAMFAPVWEAVPSVAATMDRATLDHLRLIADPDDPQCWHVLEQYPGLVCIAHGDDARLGSVSAGDHLCWFAPRRSPGDSDGQAPVVALLQFVRRMLSLGAAHLPLEWTIVTRGGQPTHADEPVDPHQAAVHGLAGTMAKEYPAWRFRVVDVDAGDTALAGAGFAQMLGLKPDRRGRPWVARTVDDDGGPVRLQWRQQRLIPLLVDADPSSVYRKGGIYIVIGGAGDIGGVWSEHVIRSAGAQVVWVGRRPEDETIRAKIEGLAKIGPRPLYLSADATDGDALAGVREEVKRRFGRIDGVIHSALVFFEKGLAELDTATFLTGFRAKASSCVHLARVFANEELDFVALFSSVVAQIKNPRQGAYAAGCAFVDALAHELNRLWRCPVKTINWGYWSSTKQEVADESAYRAFMRLAEIGIGLIEPAEGMRALDCLLAGPLQQIGIVKTTRSVEIEGLDVTQALRLPVAPTLLLPLISGLEESQANLSELQAQGEIAGLDELILPLLQLQMVAAREFSDIGNHLDAWRQESLALLERHGRIVRGASGWRELVPVDAEAAWQSWKDCRARCDADPAKRAQLELAEVALRALPDMLSSRRRPTDILFPQGSMQLVEAVHRNNPVADYFQKNVAALTVAALRQSSRNAPSKPLRILEVGAGTGSTTSAVLRELNDPANRDVTASLADYTYTDLSKAFLQHGEKAFGAMHPALRFQIFDIERPPLDQGLDFEAYDVVIAGNVLHATRDIRRTLQNVKSLLRPSGILLACEVSQNALFTHLTFGLLEGWWLSEDPELRMSGSPGLTPGAWQRTLQEEGFPKVAFPLADAHALGQQIILAHSDGVARQRRSAPAVAAVGGKAAEPRSQDPVVATNDGALALFREILAGVLKMPVAEIDPEAPLDRYGMDSILAVTLAEDLNRHFDSVSSTLVFEHQTVAAIADHFVRTQGSIVARLLRERGEPGDAPARRLSPVQPVEKSAPAPRSSRPSETATDDRIAVIGMSGRFPGADNVDALWDLLREGRSAIGDMPADRWDQNQRDLFKGDASQFNTRGGYASDIQCFDPLFFGISPMEAKWIDPRQRLFLEEAWHAFEDAGRMGEQLRGSNCAVYVGVEEGEYGFLTNGRGQISSNQIASLAARIAYFLDLHGPNFALSAACSSGLVAIHQACQALRSGECDMALAGGVSLIVSPVVHLGLAHSRMLSTGGECRVFDAASSGMVPADGVAAVVLKRLDDAVRDNDRIYGCIRASGVNYDGKTMGLAAPNPRSQSSLIESIYQRADLSADAIQFVLAHSVGSAVTDAVEVQALSEAYSRQGAAAAGCRLSSIKPLIGHSFAASGVVSLIAMLQAMRHATMPGTHGFSAAHANIRLDGSPFTIAAENRVWPRPADDVRRGAIGTTGLSGTNAHAVIEEFVPPARAASSPDGPQIFVFSATTQDRLGLVLKRFADALDGLRQTPLRDIAYTLQAGREPLAKRLAFVARDWQSLRATAEACRNALGSGADAAIAGCHVGDVGKSANALTGLFSGPAGAMFMSSLVENRELDRLAMLWAQGGQIPWRQLHGDEEPARVGLPGYPFAREHYWATDASSVAAAAKPDAAASSPKSGLEETIRQFLAGQLDMRPDALPDETHWRDYGVDSIIETRLMLMLEETLGLSMTGRELADHPSIAALSRHLASVSTEAVVEPPQVGDTMLSEGQQGLWMLDQLDPGGAARNIPIAFEIPGPWNRAAFAQAIAVLYRQVPLLRAAVFEQEGEPRLRTTPEGTLDFQTASWPGFTGDDAIAFLRAEAQRPFALATGPLMRVRMWTGRDGRDVVLIVFHHLIFDGASAVTFFKSLWSAYDAIAGGRGMPTLEQGTSYAEFVEWERDMLRGPRGQVLRDYWLRQMSGAPSATSLPSDRSATSSPVKRAGKTHRRTLDPILAARLRDLGRARGLRTSVIFLALYQSFIAKLACSDDPVIGLVAQVRPQSRFENAIGYFVNTVPIRQKIDPSLPFLAHAQKIQETMIAALDHAAYPFPVLVRELSPADHRGEAPVFQSVFAFQNFVPKRLKDDRNTYGSVLAIVPIAEITAEGDDDLALEVLEEADSFTLLFKYASDLWNEATIESLADAFIQMAEALVDNPEGPWRQIHPAAPPSAWIVGGPSSSVVPDIAAAVESAARQTPDATAVVLAGDSPCSIDYRELDARASQLALLLVASCPDVTRPVGVCLKRSIDSIVVLLGLLKSGLTYLPLDPHDAPQRLAGVIGEAAPGCLIVDEETASLAAAACGDTGKLLHIKDCLSRAAAYPAHEPVTRADTDVPAYIIFTSGSTGMPKGVVVGRDSLSTHCHEMVKRLACSGADRVLQFTPLHLDPSLEQILVALSASATVIMRDEELWTAGQFWDQVCAHDISVVDVTASYLRELLVGAPQTPPPSLRTVIVGGEAFPVDLYWQWQSSSLSRVALINAYGPTEATITSAMFEVSQGTDAAEGARTVPIGRPLAGQEIVILDDHGQLCAEGFPGELYIGGSGVARGYLRRRELTLERFGAPPQSTLKILSSGRFFRTGDLGRYIPGTDGLIECLGRRDRQVKIRGVRVELDEVAGVIRSFPPVTDCVVSVEGDAQGDLQLSAMLSFAPGQDASAELQRLRNFLEQRLPTAMVPTKLRLANGAIYKSRETEPYQAPDRRVAAMIRLWEDLLQTTGILPSSGFFHLGGHSLLAIRLLHRIEQQFGVRIALSVFLRDPTVEAVCRQLDGAGQGGAKQAISAVAADDRPLFFIHGGDGPLFTEQAFATFLAPTPFHVLQPLADDNQQESITVETLAARCADEIRRRQPAGPYRLCGWSFGGLLAFEVAVQLRTLGEEITLLALLDSYTPQHLPEPGASTGTGMSLAEEFRESLLATCGVDLTAGLPFGIGEPPMPAVEVLVARAREAGQIQTDTEATHILRSWRSFVRQVTAMGRYTPRSYAGDLVLIRAQDELDRTSQGNDMRAGWEACCTGRIEVLQVAGDHYSVMQPPSVDRLIRLVVERLHIGT